MDAFFRNSLLISLGDGRSVLFWTDKWINGQSAQNIAPFLWETITPKCRRSRSVAQALDHNAWRKDITGPLSIPVLIDYVRLRQATAEVHLNSAVSDSIRWKWSPSGQFMVQSAYRALFIGQTRLAGARELWKTKAPNNCRFFYWLVLHGRVWTAARRYRHNLQNTNDCILCSQQPEELDHLILQCVYSRELWFKALRRHGWQHLAPTQQDHFVDWWLRSRKLVPSLRRKAFDSVVLLTGWHIWLERNARTFNNVTATVHAVLIKVHETTEQWCRAKLIDRLALHPGQQ